MTSFFSKPNADTDTGTTSQSKAKQPASAPEPVINVDYMEVL